MPKPERHLSDVFGILSVWMSFLILMMSFIKNTIALLSYLRNVGFIESTDKIK